MKYVLSDKFHGHGHGFTTNLTDDAAYIANAKSWQNFNGQKTFEAAGGRNAHHVGIEA